jgi:hypothetical protein
MRSIYKVLAGKPKGKGLLGKPRRNGRTVLKSILKKQDGWM